jgi:hypothetical protein
MVGVANEITTQEMKLHKNKKHPIMEAKFASNFIKLTKILIELENALYYSISKSQVDPENYLSKLLSKG